MGVSGKMAIESMDCPQSVHSPSMPTSGQAVQMGKDIIFLHCPFHSSQAAVNVPQRLIPGPELVTGKL
jgi:hypothetical protein